MSTASINPYAWLVDSVDERNRIDAPRGATCLVLGTGDLYYFDREWKALAGPAKKVGPRGPRGDPGSVDEAMLEKAVETAVEKVVEAFLQSPAAAHLKGVAGEPGRPGPPGSAGPKGAPGRTGPRGERGVQGDPGAASNVPGPKGETGRTGVVDPHAIEVAVEAFLRSSGGAAFTNDATLQAAIDRYMRSPKAAHLKGGRGPEGPEGREGRRGEKGDKGDPAPPIVLDAGRPDSTFIQALLENPLVRDQLRGQRGARGPVPDDEDIRRVVEAVLQRT